MLVCRHFVEAGVLSQERQQLNSVLVELLDALGKDAGGHILRVFLAQVDHSLLADVF